MSIWNSFSLKTPIIQIRRTKIMVKVSSLFSQLLDHFPATKFTTLVKKHQAERNAKGFTCWTQLVSMLFCHLAHADSLRDICNGLSCCLGKLIHLGIGKAPNKSTLSYANSHRPADLFRDLYYETLDHFRNHGGLGKRKVKFRFRNKLLRLDSTTISLCLNLFPWASFRRTKGGVKLHVLLDHDDYMPSYVLITEARKHDRTTAKTLRLQKGSIIVVDRAYTDFSLFCDWIEQGIFFVTRMKENAQYEVLEKRPLPQNRSILADEIIQFTGYLSRKKCPHPLRRIVYWDKENQRELVFLTNHMTFGATTIAAIYKDRWEIELFFKTLKQHLKIRTFVGTSENALLIQIWTALIALLLIKYLHFISTFGWSMSNLACLLRMNLFTYRPLQEWINNPYGVHPITPQGEQLQLPLPMFRTATG
jgi:hypothetical protein